METISIRCQTIIKVDTVIRYLLRLGIDYTFVEDCKVIADVVEIDAVFQLINATRKEAAQLRIGVETLLKECDRLFAERN